MNTAQIFVATLATAFGIYYAFLGIAAVKYLRNGDETDKAVGWTLWWCVDANRYSEGGQRLCKKGLVVALVSIVLWISVYAVKW